MLETVFGSKARGTARWETRILKGKSVAVPALVALIWILVLVAPAWSQEFPSATTSDNAACDQYGCPEPAPEETMPADPADPTQITPADPAVPAPPVEIEPVPTEPGLAYPPALGEAEPEAAATPTEEPMVPSDDGAGAPDPDSGTGQETTTAEDPNTAPIYLMGDPCGADDCGLDVPDRYECALDNLDYYVCYDPARPTTHGCFEGYAYRQDGTLIEGRDVCAQSGVTEDECGEDDCGLGVPLNYVCTEKTDLARDEHYYECADAASVDEGCFTVYRYDEKGAATGDRRTGCYADSSGPFPHEYLECGEGDCGLDIPSSNICYEKNIGTPYHRWECHDPQTHM